MVIAGQPLVWSLKARIAELEAKSARKSAWLKQTMTKLTKAQTQLCEEKQLRAVAEARLCESESRANGSEETIKVMQQRIAKLKGENQDLNVLKTFCQKNFSNAEKANADQQAKLRVQGHAPPLSPKAKQGPTPKPRGAGS